MSGALFTLLRVTRQKGAERRRDSCCDDLLAVADEEGAMQQPSLADDLAHLLHCAPADGAELAAARRAVAPVWLEAAAHCRRAGGTLVLRWLSLASALHVDVCVDEQSRMVYHAGERAAPALEAALAHVNARLAAAAAGGGGGGAPPPTLMLIAAWLSRQLALDAGAVWCELAQPEASAMARFTGRALADCACHPALAGLPARTRLAGALAGVGMQATMLSNALQTLRRQLVCHPVPPCFMLGPGGGPRAAAAASGPQQQPQQQQQQQQHLGSHREFDAAALAAAIAGLPRLAPWLNEAATGPGDAASDDLAAALAALAVALPAGTLRLLYWLACLAPTRLVRVPHARRARGVDDNKAGVDDDDAVAAAAAALGSGQQPGERVERFAVVHGPAPPEWAACSHNRSSGSGGGGGGAGGGECACDGTGARTWDEPAARRHGLLRRAPAPAATAAAPPAAALTLYHGSASENAHSIASNGLRALSGTRHEASGSIYGGGVYLTDDAAVSAGFTKAVGLAWDGGALPPLGDGDRGGGGGGGPASLAAPCRFRPVFACEVVAAPDNGVYQQGSKVAGGVADGTAAFPPGAYLVVPRPAHVRITGLLVLTASPAAAQRRAPAAPLAGAPAKRGSALLPWALLVAVLLVAGWAWLERRLLR